jgi:aerotaxis receptor
MASAVEALQQLSPDLAALRHEVADLGFRIGLARLYTEMVGAFAAEVIDGAAPVGSLAAVPRLCDAVHDGVIAMAAATEAVNASLAAVSGQIHRAGQLMHEFRRFLGQWRILVMRHRQGGAVGDHLGPIDAQLDAMADQLDYLDSLAQRCDASIAPVDREATELHLQRVRAVLGHTAA